MKKLLLMFLMGTVFISGCIGGVDVAEILEQTEEGSDFLENYPNAEITIEKVSKGVVESIIDEISAACGSPMEVKDYWKVTLYDPDTGVEMIGWIEVETQELVCLIEKGGTQKESLTITMEIEYGKLIGEALGDVRDDEESKTTEEESRLAGQNATRSEVLEGLRADEQYILSRLATARTTMSEERILSEMTNKLEELKQRPNLDQKYLDLIADVEKDIADVNAGTVELEDVFVRMNNNIRAIDLSTYEGGSVEELLNAMMSTLDSIDTTDWDTIQKTIDVLEFELIRSRATGETFSNETVSRIEAKIEELNGIQFLNDEFEDLEDLTQRANSIMSQGREDWAIMDILTDMRAMISALSEYEDEFTEEQKVKMATAVEVASYAERYLMEMKVRIGARELAVAEAKLQAESMQYVGDGTNYSYSWRDESGWKDLDWRDLVEQWEEDEEAGVPVEEQVIEITVEVPVEEEHATEEESMTEEEDTIEEDEVTEEQAGVNETEETETEPIDRTVDQKCCADGTYSQPTRAVWMPIDEECPDGLFRSWSKWCDESETSCADICEGESGLLIRPMGDGGYCDCTIDRTVDQKCCADGTYSQPTRTIWVPIDDNCPSYRISSTGWTTLFWSWSKWCDDSETSCADICEGGEPGVLRRPLGDGGYCDCTIDRTVDQKCCSDSPAYSAPTRMQWMPIDEDCPVYEYEPNHWATLFWSWPSFCDDSDISCADICEGGEPGVLRSPLGERGYCDCTIDRTVDQKCCADTSGYSAPTWSAERRVWMPIDEDCPVYEYEPNHWATLFWSWSKYCDEYPTEGSCADICEGETGVLFRPIGDGGYCDCTIDRTVDQKCCVDDFVNPSWSDTGRVWVPIDEECPPTEVAPRQWGRLVRAKPDHCDVYPSEGSCSEICAFGEGVVVGRSDSDGYCDCPAFGEAPIPAPEIGPVTTPDIGVTSIS